MALRARFASALVASLAVVGSLGACGAAHEEPNVPPPTTATPSAPAPFAVVARDADAGTPVSTRSGWPAAVLALEATAKSAPHAADLARSLSDEVGPRLAGSPADALAVAWAKKTMGTVGLEDVHAEPVTLAPWARGVETARLVAPFAQKLEVTALGGSVATPPNGIEANVVEVASLDALGKLTRADVAGKIVFLNQPMARTRDGHGYGDAVGARFVGAGKAQDLGAVAFVIRSLSTARDRFPHTGAKGKDAHEIPAGALSVSDAELLHRILSETGSAKMRLVLTPHAVAHAMSANVVGDVRAKGADADGGAAGDLILLGAHLDSWDLGTGAIDDAAGCGIVLEAARLLHALPERPRRTVRIVLFASEEHGGFGAKAYGEAHKGEADRTALAIEADMGADVVYEARYLGAPEGRVAFQALTRLLAPLGIAASDQDAEGGADVHPLRRLGVPVVDLRQDASTYFDFHHSANDTVDKIDPDRIEQAALALAITAWWAGNAEPPVFGRVPESKRASKW